MGRTRVTRSFGEVVGAAVLLTLVAPGTCAAETPADVETEHGLTLVMTGETVRAESVFALLRRAAVRVPSDTSRVGDGAPAQPGRRKIAPTWRSASPRAFADSDIAALLYWKR